MVLKLATMWHWEMSGVLLSFGLIFLFFYFEDEDEDGVERCVLCGGCGGGGVG